MARQDGGCAFLGCLLVILSLLFWYEVAQLACHYAFGLE